MAMFAEMARLSKTVGSDTCVRREKGLVREARVKGYPASTRTGIQRDVFNKCLVCEFGALMSIILTNFRLLL